MKVLWRFSKAFLVVLVTLLLLVNLYILLSGRFYLYKGIYHTYLQGKTGPGIYDLEVFPYTTIETAQSKPYPSQLKEDFQWSDSLQKLHKQLGTTAFLVVQSDTLRLEQYFGGHEPSTKSNSFSSAKTMVALLVGIALEEGKIRSIDDKVSRYLPNYANKGRQHLSIRDLLVMASGLSWTESGKDPLSDNAESYYGSQLEKLLLRQKQEREPGKIFCYQSGNSQLLGMIVEAATQKSLSDYAEEKLWRPLGAEYPAHWNLDREGGMEKAFCCVYAAARDFAKIGSLILHHGRWNNRQIVPQKYVEEMIVPAPLLTEEGLPNTRYGMHIWLTRYEGNDVIYCRGILGQYIIVIPAKNTVIVRLGHHRLPNYTYEEYQAGEIPLEWIDHPREVFAYLKELNRL